MSRCNLDPLLTFPDGSHLVISTQHRTDGDFTCALYKATLGEDDAATFGLISDGLAASTCRAAQDHAYRYALRIYPTAEPTLKKPPYLIWQGPAPTF